MKQTIRSLFLVISTLLATIFAASAGERHALLIGVSAYTGAAPLTNPIKDATALAERLKGAGWEITLCKDASRSELEKTLTAFAARSRTAEASLIYFAGHGFEIEGLNFLAPVDLKSDSRESIKSTSFSLDEAMSMLKQAGGLKFIILDSCRENPFATRSAEGSKLNVRGGMAKVDDEALPASTLLVFAGAPGKTVPDGSGQHSPFAAAFLKSLTPGESALSVFTGIAKQLKGQKPYVRFDDAVESLDAFQKLVLIPGKPGVPQVDGKPAPDGKAGKSPYEMKSIAGLEFTPLSLTVTQDGRLHVRGQLTNPGATEVTAVSGNLHSGTYWLNTWGPIPDFPNGYVLMKEVRMALSLPTGFGDPVPNGIYRLPKPEVASLGALKLAAKESAEVSFTFEGQYGQGVLDPSWPDPYPVTLNIELRVLSGKSDQMRSATWEKAIVPPTHQK